jgi:hypothetical protein
MTNAHLRLRSTSFGFAVSITITPSLPARALPGRAVPLFQKASSAPFSTIVVSGLGPALQKSTIVTGRENRWYRL